LQIRREPFFLGLVENNAIIHGKMIKKQLPKLVNEKRRSSFLIVKAGKLQI
jgi:hypothetical protein